MTTSEADILREYGPFPGVENVAGVTFDGETLWFASGDKVNAMDPDDGSVLRSIDVAAHAGTAFDGRHLFQIAEDRIRKIDPASGAVLAPPFEEQYADVLALFADGEAWSSSALAIALGTSARTVQRTLEQLSAAGKVQSIGRGRTQRWLTPTPGAFSTLLLLPGPLPGD